MSGPGQGKRAHKKKWHNNARAVHAILAAAAFTPPNAITLTVETATSSLLSPSNATATTPLANEMAPQTGTYTTTKSTTTMATAPTMAKCSHSSCT
jgi:hypothetical protein